MTVRVVGTAEPDVLARLAAAGGLATLEEVLAWCHATGGDVVDVVVQDEFSHDVLVRVASLWLCFDTT